MAEKSSICGKLALVGELLEQELLVAAFERLRDLLSADDTMQLRQYPSQLPDSDREAAWEVSAPGYASRLLVEAFRRFVPRDLDRVLGGISPLVRKMMNDPAVVIVAPWISPRSRDLLTQRGLNYLDLTGNVRLKVALPAIYLRLDGAQHDPNPPAKQPVRLNGTSINRLIRVLVDVEPPYRMVDLSRATGLSNSYVSRTLEVLHDERLIERSAKQKTITDVDWQGLLRARAEHYNLLKTNHAQTFLARTGPGQLIRQLAETNDDQTVITGSFAASNYVSVAAPTQLVLYVPSINDAARRLGLMPAQQGANVLLLRAADESQVDRLRSAPDGTFHVGVSQLTLDCLAGNGRLPEEGEALIEWMAENIPAWRRLALPPSR